MGVEKKTVHLRRKLITELSKEDIFINVITVCIQCFVVVTSNRNLLWN